MLASPHDRLASGAVFGNFVFKLDDELDDRQRSTEQRGVWTVTGRDTSSERVTDVIDTADEEVVYMTVGDRLTDAIVDRLRAASERDVAAKLAEIQTGVEADLTDAVPEAEVFESL